MEIRSCHNQRVRLQELEEGLFAFLLPNVFGQKDKAKTKMAVLQISKISTALESFYNDCDQYPQALRQLVDKPSENICENWQPRGYLKNEKEILDPWKREFVYELEGGGYIVKSLGQDGQEGGSDYAKDISSEDL